MTRPSRPWSDLTPTERAAAVKQLTLDGFVYGEIMERLGAPSRSAISGVIFRLRERGELPPAGSVIMKAPNAKKARTVDGTTKRPPVKIDAFPNRPGRPPKVGAARPATAQLFVFPSSAPPKVTAAMVEAYVAANGVRRFETGISGDLDALRGYLSRHGYDVAFIQRGKHPYQIRGNLGRPRNVDRSGLFAFVDELRIAEGKEPFIRRCS